MYKWGWDQKNKKNEDGEDSDEDQDANIDEQSKQDDEKKDSDSTKNKGEELKQQLDLAISQVVIGNDELHHGIILPHKLNDISGDSSDQKENSDLVKDK